MIDYYGYDDNYIHAKFGDLRKQYNFTESFIEQYPNFAYEYGRYFRGELSRFLQPQQIVKYVDKYKIPVRFYFNFTDTPASIDDMFAYFDRELAVPDNLDKEVV